MPARDERWEARRKELYITAAAVNMLNGLVHYATTGIPEDNPWGRALLNEYRSPVTDANGFFSSLFTTVNHPLAYESHGRAYSLVRPLRSRKAARARMAADDVIRKVRADPLKQLRELAERALDSGGIVSAFKDVALPAIKEIPSARDDFEASTAEAPAAKELTVEMENPALGNFIRDYRAFREKYDAAR